MRILGFVGIVLLLPFNVFGMLLTFQNNDWRGVALMACMTAMLAYFARMLWLGRRMEREVCSSKLAQGWYGESVSSFFLNQVAKSPEGLILLIGSSISLALAITALFIPTALGLPVRRANTAPTIFGIWPILAFVLYVRICGPAFGTSTFTCIAMLAVVCAPAVIVYR